MCTSSTLQDFFGVFAATSERIIGRVSATDVFLGHQVALPLITPPPPTPLLFVVFVFFKSLRHPLKTHINAEVWMRVPAVIAAR